MGPFIFFAVVGVFLIAISVFSGRPGRARDTLRTMYLNEGFLVPVRMLVVTAPLTGAAFFAMGLAIALPRYYAAWLVGTAACVGIVAMVLSYRPPDRLVPKWFRDEIASGTVPPIRKDFIDWTYSALLLALAIAGPIALVLLIVVYGAAGSPP